jgi:hypothetical protein
MASKFLKSFIYPQGHVHKNYGKYVAWSSLSNLIISTESVLSTHSMLSTIGHSSNELTFSINYVGKDIIGQLGGLYFMNKMGSKADKNPKDFIKYSMFLQQSAVVLECATPLLPLGSFIPVAGVANVTKNISFTGFGAVNAKIIQKLAQEDNVGEIYAKISVLNTIGSSIGMGLGLVIASQIQDHTMRLGFIPILAWMRIYSYNKAISGLID